MTVGLHPRWSGQASRAAAVRDFLAHVTSTPEVALVHREQVAQWWVAQGWMAQGWTYGG